MSLRGEEIDDAGRNDDSDGKDNISENMNVCSFHIDIIVKLFFGMNLLFRGQAWNMDLFTEFVTGKFKSVFDAMTTGFSFRQRICINNGRRGTFLFLLMRLTFMMMRVFAFSMPVMIMMIMVVIMLVMFVFLLLFLMLMVIMTT